MLSSMPKFDLLAHYFINILVTEVRSFIAKYPIREDDYWLEIFIFAKYIYLQTAKFWSYTFTGQEIIFWQPFAIKAGLNIEISQLDREKERNNTNFSSSTFGQTSQGNSQVRL